MTFVPLSEKVFGYKLPNDQIFYDRTGIILMRCVIDVSPGITLAMSADTRLTPCHQGPPTIDITFATTISSHSAVVPNLSTVPPYFVHPEQSQFNIQFLSRLFRNC